MTLLKNKVGHTYPSLLYKYKVDIAHLKDIFLTSELFFPKPDLLNDPFDIRFFIDDDSYNSIITSKRPSSISEHKLKLIMKFMEEEKEMNKEFFSELFNKFVRSSITILSMSRLNNSRLLWGYYAGGYTGYCIEFDLSSEVSFFKNTIFEVDYSLEGDMIPRDRYKDLSKVENFYKPFIIKNKDWFHEEEYRAIVSSFNLDSTFERIKIEKKLIKSITFGYKADNVAIHNLRAIADQNGFQHVEFYKLNHTNSGLIKKEVEF